ncbi:glycosyltransferase family 2 protein [Streptacidiphilus sp. EB129]|jgi:cellulose synthase/poly-beta-1,6-N-acetylglucosamine synthase-like glycosyltransferase|uniref:glycosyltransferase family 2 protein n=1 Tax=Streptacidiphilus sp. EB129 TaxID=3156262 RepID=UPI003519A4DE
MRNTEHVHIQLSVVICVYTEDRWEALLAAVDSAVTQDLPPLDVLVIVDHNPALLRRLQDRYATDPLVRVLANAGRRGLSGGRNTGIAAARGEIVAFLDDDAVAEPDWLRWFADGYRDPAVQGVGGLTLPVWESGRRPRWYPEEFDWVHGATYRGMPTGRARVRNVLGGNASFRRTAFATVGGFDAGIGRGAGADASDGVGIGRAGRQHERRGDRRGDRRAGRLQPLGGEETELCIRIQQDDPGAVFLFDDRSVIHHRVPHERERFAYFRTRCWAEGLSKAKVAGRVGAGDGLSSERRYVTRTLPAGIARSLGGIARGDLAGLARAGAIAVGGLITAVGFLVGSLRRRSGRRP